MWADVSRHEGVAHVHLRGDVTFESRQSFAEVHYPLLRDTSVCVVHVDFSAVTAVDNAGLGLLMLLNDRAARAKKWVALSNASGRVLDLFRVADMSRRIAFVPANGRLEDLWAKA